MPTAEETKAEFYAELAKVGVLPMDKVTPEKWGIVKMVFNKFGIPSSKIPANTNILATATKKNTMLNQLKGVRKVQYGGFVTFIWEAVRDAVAAVGGWGQIALNEVAGAVISVRRNLLRRQQGFRAHELNARLFNPVYPVVQGVTPADIRALPRTPIIGDAEFDDILMMTPIPEGTEVIRILGRLGDNPERSTYIVSDQVLDHLTGSGLNFATRAPFTIADIQIGPYVYRRPASGDPVDEDPSGGYRKKRRSTNRRRRNNRKSRSRK